MIPEKSTDKRNSDERLSAYSLGCSIVIRCYNEEKHIGKLLHGIMQQTVQDVEIIVVDSGSSDETLKIAARYPAKILSIHPEEFSFGHSLNLGFGAAEKQFVVMASAHVYPLHKDWLEQLLRPFEDPEICLVYGKQLGGESTKFSERQIFEKWFPDRSNYSQDTPFCNNANAAVRRNVWQQYPYDQELTGLEDLAWAHGVMKNGYRIAYQSRAAVVHVHDEKPLQIYNRYKREAIALKKIFPSEKFNLWDFFRLFNSNAFNDLRQALVSKKMLSNFPGIITFRLMQFWGTFCGFSGTGQISSHLRQKFYYPNQQVDKSGSSALQDKKDSLLIDYRSGDRP